MSLLGARGISWDEGKAPINSPLINCGELVVNSIMGQNFRTNNLPLNLGNANYRNFFSIQLLIEFCGMTMAWLPEGISDKTTGPQHAADFFFAQ